ncbi:MAG: efflux RND transporter periplasmic adaptor subunit [Azonexus sp.]|nr:efflux RND transporter periplasmic adaptor subunit [Azonexus sp.]MDZ4316820.1 efflux RND transporter periplasmic adaptor subunit [Azonexus sp.]
MRNALFILLTAAVLAGCNNEEVKTVAAPLSDSALVTPAAELVAQIKLANVSSQPVAETLRVPGSIDFDKQHFARIGATITGRVTEIDAVLGQSVKKGDVLARLNSSELSTQQLAYLRARAELELNRRNAERAKALFEADVIALAELQRRQSEHQISVAETRAAADQLQLLGVTPAAIERLGRDGAVNSLMSVVSTLSGVVVERKLAQGQVVQPADSLFVVADLSSLWAVAQVPEQQISRVKEGQSVIIEVPALGDEKLWGKLVFVGQTVDPATRTVLVRTALDNRDGRLKPAMLASLLIEAKPADRLVIPAAAVVRENDTDHVFVAEASGAFRLVKVKLGVEQGGQRVVLNGLKGDERIVVEGAFHLNNERNRIAAEGS